MGLNDVFVNEQAMYPQQPTADVFWIMTVQVAEIIQQNKFPFVSESRQNYRIRDWKN